MELLDFSGVKIILFDFMGTCLDWHSSIVNVFPHRLSLKLRSALAISWREALFEDIHERFEQGQAPEDIDVTHARLLSKLVLQDRFLETKLSSDEQQRAVQAWHSMKSWPDIPNDLKLLRERYEVFVAANGTTRLQLDLVRSSGLDFSMLFSSQLLELTKPDPRFYQKVLDLVGVKPEESIMVAAHAYDLRAAKKIGMKTVYIHRWTEDTREDMDQVRQEVDLFIDGTQSDEKCGLNRLVELMQYIKIEEKNE